MIIHQSKPHISYDGGTDVSKKTGEVKVSTRLFMNYKVYSDGRLQNSRGKFIAGGYSVSRSGRRYKNFDLYFKGKRKTFYAHRLIYQVFKGEIAEGYEIDHIDSDTLNNRLDNLEIVTKSENQKRWRIREASKREVETKPIEDVEWLF